MRRQNLPRTVAAEARASQQQAAFSNGGGRGGANRRGPRADGARHPPRHARHRSLIKRDMQMQQLLIALFTYCIYCSTDGFFASPIARNGYANDPIPRPAYQNYARPAWDEEQRVAAKSEPMKVAGVVGTGPLYLMTVAA